MGDTLEYKVEGILRHKGKGARRYYLVLWKGYPLHEATWEPESHLSNAQDVLEEYLCQFQSGIERDGKSGGVPSRSYDPRVRSMRMGIDDIGVSAMGPGESPLMWHRFRPPNL